MTHKRLYVMNRQDAPTTLRVRAFQGSDYKALTGQTIQRSYEYAFTALVGGKIAACGGVERFAWAPVGEAWIVVGALGLAHSVFVARVVVRHLRALIREMDLTRVEAWVFADFRRCRHWLEKMGFQHEGTAHRRGPNGEDMACYGLLL